MKQDLGSISTKPCTVTAHKWSQVFVPEAVDGTLLQTPVLALWFSIPSDGLPQFPHWVNTAKDVYLSGFESHREPLECKVRDEASGDCMAKFEVTKGLGRTSIILFGIIFSYLEMAADLTNEELQDFQRRTYQFQTSFNHEAMFLTTRLRVDHVGTQIQTK